MAKNGRVCFYRAVISGNGQEQGLITGFVAISDHLTADEVEACFYAEIGAKFNRLKEKLELEGSILFVGLLNQSRLYNVRTKNSIHKAPRLCITAVN